MRTPPPILPHRMDVERRADGSLMLTSGYSPGPVARCTGEWLQHWAQATPDTVFLAERSGNGWRSVSYGEALQQVRAIACGLLARGFDQDTPILIVSGNGVDHGLLMLAAQYVGVPTLAVAEQYALVEAAHGRLRHAAELIKPAMVFADDGAKYAEALALDCFEGAEKVVGNNPVAGQSPFAELSKGGTSSDVDAAFAQLTPQTIAKYLMTSGSTSLPKAVETTQLMLCFNQAQIAQALPLLTVRPPVLLDWLPWNHTFGGSHNFNIVLANGGTLYIDEGKPVPGLFEKTLANLAMVAGNIAFNVPVGFALLLEAFRNDDSLKRNYFGDLDMMFYAGATLPQDVWRGLEEMAREVTGTVPLLTSSWGLTETAPAALLQHEPPESSGIVGVPLAGTVVKLVPQGDSRYEVRVAGDNIMKRYFQAPEKTAEAFDDEGFFITGDAMKFLDPDAPQKGLRFDGRISEDFKLLTGTWVRASTLRLDLLRALAPFVQDLVVTGQERNEIGLMLVPNRVVLEKVSGALTGQDGVFANPQALEKIAERLRMFNAENSGSSTRIACAVLLEAPPSMAEGEMTAKGNLNFNKLLQSRAGIVTWMHEAGDNPAVIRLEKQT